VREGEIVGLGGLPDQGQLAVLNCLFGLAEVRAPAEIMLDGARLNLRSSTDAVRAGIAYVSGDRDEVGFAIRSLRENMSASLINRGGSLALDFRGALASLLTVYADLLQPLNALSGGNQQKVLLARCFLLRPKVLLAADPTKGIDVGARAEVHAALRRLAAELGTVVVFISSDDRELAEICDRVLVMERRRIIRELRAGVDLDEQTLIESYMRPGSGAGAETTMAVG
jgi:ribose transport system ATP-binding protein